MSSNPDGAACYRATIRAFATVDMPAETVFDTGLAEITRIEGEMRAIAARSFGNEALTTLLPRLRTDPQYTFKNSQEIIDASEAVIVRAKSEMGQMVRKSAPG